MINNSYESSSSSSEASSLSGSPIPLANFTNYWQAYNLDTNQTFKNDTFSSYPYYNFSFTTDTTSQIQPLNAKSNESSPQLDHNVSYNYANKLASSYYYQHENESSNVQTLPFINAYHNTNNYLDSYTSSATLSSQEKSSQITSPHLTVPPKQVSTPVVESVNDKRQQPPQQMPVKTGSVVNRRRNRTQFSLSQIQSLESVFEKTHYPEVQLVDRLSEKLNLSIERISIWFQNRRAKDKKSKKHGTKKESAQTHGGNDNSNQMTHV
jgi:hypothetical protein